MTFRLEHTYYAQVQSPIIHNDRVVAEPGSLITVKYLGDASPDNYRWCTTLDDHEDYVADHAIRVISSSRAAALATIIANRKAENRRAG